MRRAALLIGFVVLLAAMLTPARAGSPCTVPRSWGEVRAAYAGSYGQTIFVFEGADGTVRTVPANCKTPAGPVDTVLRSDN